MLYFNQSPTHCFGLQNLRIAMFSMDAPTGKLNRYFRTVVLERDVRAG
jgi:hypothetical protein